MEANTVEHVGYLPMFITGPGQTDVLLVGMIIFTIVLVLLIGVFYLYLHSLPERMAHKSNSVQLQLVGVLALLSLFTHNNIFWVVALLIVAIRVPDFLTPVNSIAASLQRLSGTTTSVAERASPPAAPATPSPAQATPDEDAHATATPESDTVDAEREGKDNA
nr:hypothetical protein [Marinicella sp. W31]MDC2877934.1 hypothetical protein [Marinicella sp. W31]